MKTIPISSLYHMDYKICNVVTTYQYHNENDKYVMKNRSGNGFLILTNCMMTAELNADVITAISGDICYAPQESCYRTCYSNCPEAIDGKMLPTNMLINFILEDEKKEQFRFSEQFIYLGKSMNYYYMEMLDFLVMASSRGSIPMGRVKAILYDFLTDLSMRFMEECFQSQSYASIYPAIDFIEKNYLRPITITELAKMCVMSETSFRRLFKQYSGMSPLSYILHLKINRAKLLLEVGGFSINQAAEASGFDDAAYFSRIYKKKTGISPSGINKNR